MFFTSYKTLHQPHKIVQPLGSTRDTTRNYSEGSNTLPNFVLADFILHSTLQPLTILFSSNMSSKTLHSPKKPLQPSLSFHSDSPPSNSSPSLSYPDCRALSEDYTLESTSFLRTLLKSSQERLQAVERHWKDSINSLDHRVKGLSLERFVDEFRGDMESALREVVREEVGMRPMGIVEQSARKR